MKIAVLVSGALGLHVLVELLNTNCTITAVFTDKKSAEIANLATEHSIPLFIGNPRGGKAAGFIADREVDVVASVNYLFLIERDIIGWPKKVAFNIHGSLLPKYRGRTPHVWAIINNESETGITAHTIDEDCDTGWILKQITVPIDLEDTGGSLLRKFRDRYPKLVNEILKGVEKGGLTPTPQDESKATYFGKRTPEDGRIDWSWSKERIRNWVRAQADPYPGAFTYHGNQQIIIDQVEFSDLGYSGEMPNGLVLRSEPLTVKSPNGAVVAVRHRYQGEAIPVKTILDE